jgi:hypothetical protein
LRHGELLLLLSDELPLGPDAPLTPEEYELDDGVEETPVEELDKPDGPLDKALNKVLDKEPAEELSAELLTVPSTL